MTTTTALDDVSPLESTFWEAWDKRECVGHFSTLVSARRACRNDTGRALRVYDPTGRIAALYQDGKEVR